MTLFWTEWTRFSEYADQNESVGKDLCMAIPYLFTALAYQIMMVLFMTFYGYYDFPYVMEKVKSYWLVWLVLALLLITEMVGSREKQDEQLQLQSRLKDLNFAHVGIGTFAFVTIVSLLSYGPYSEDFFGSFFVFAIMSVFCFFFYIRGNMIHLNRTLYNGLHGKLVILQNVVTSSAFIYTTLYPLYSPNSIPKEFETAWRAGTVLMTLSILAFFSRFYFPLVADYVLLFWSGLEGFKRVDMEDNQEQEANDKRGEKKEDEPVVKTNQWKKKEDKRKRRNKNANRH